MKTNYMQLNKDVKNLIYFLDYIDKLEKSDKDLFYTQVREVICNKKLDYSIFKLDNSVEVKLQLNTLIYNFEVNE